jgi:hypothetical protein
MGFAWHAWDTLLPPLIPPTPLPFVRNPNFHMVSAPQLHIPPPAIMLRLDILIYASIFSSLNVVRSLPRSLMLSLLHDKVRANGTKLTTLLGSNPVDRVIAVSLCPYPAADSNSGSLTLDGLSIGVNIGDLDLDRSVVLGGDEPV